MKAYTEQLQSPRLQKSEGLGLAEALHDLDYETLRKIFKMPPALTIDDQRLEEDELVVDQSPMMKKDGGRGETEAAVYPQMKEEPGVDVSVRIKDAGI